MGKNKKSVKNKRIATKKSFMQSILVRLKTKAVQYLSPKPIPRVQPISKSDHTTCAEQKVVPKTDSSPVIKRNIIKSETADVPVAEITLPKSNSCPNLQLVDYRQASTTTIESYSSSSHVPSSTLELQITTKTSLTEQQYSLTRPVYPSRVSLSRGLDLVATMCFQGLVTISRAFAGVQISKLCSGQQSSDDSRLHRIESRIEAHDLELHRLRELIEQVGRNPVTNPPPHPMQNLLLPPPPPPPPLPPAMPLVTKLSSVMPKVIKRDQKENLRQLRPCISQEDLRAVKLRRTPCNNPKKISSVDLATPRVTLEALKSVKLKRFDSERIPLTPARDENAGARPLRTLKKLNIVRSPGGTPLRNLATENNYNEDYSGSEGLTPLMTRALQKRMAAWKGPSPTNSPTSNDSF